MDKKTLDLLEEFEAQERYKKFIKNLKRSIKILNKKKIKLK